MLLGILGKPGVEPVHIPGPAVAVCAVLIAQKAEIRIFEIVLYDGAMPGIRQLLPHGFKSGVFCIQPCVYRICCLLRTGKFPDIAKARVNKNQIRGKAIQLLVSEHGVFPVHPVFRFIKLRFYPMMKQKQIQDAHDIVGGGTAQHRDPFGDAHYPVRKKGFPDAF